MKTLPFDAALAKYLSSGLNLTYFTDPVWLSKLF